MLDTLILSRIQFAANITFHILFPTISIALAWALLYFKIKFNKTGDSEWSEAYQFWVKIFALTFALGVVSGITMSFQFGTNWPGYMQTVGNIAGPLLGYEVLSAFFLEATFLGIMLFGAKRVSQRAHTVATFLVAFGTSLSAFWIIVLDSWMQTPQGFDRQTLVEAHQSGVDATDDAALVELLGKTVRVIAGETSAFKITHPEDVERTINLLTENKSSDIRVGVGTDAHAFSSDAQRPMWLAGLHWPDEIGVDGHSDGDVAAHAICDALFAATGLGDLGSNFGTSDPKYSGASGATLLNETLARISAAGFDIMNVSVQIVGNKPKIGPRRAEAIAALSTALNGAHVSVTATTTDGLGFTGEGKGISAVATALVVRR